MARWFFVFWLIICLGVPAAASSAPTPLAKVVEAQLDLLDMGEMERLIANLDGEVQAQLPTLDIGQLILGNQGIDWGNLLGALTRYLFREVVANSRLLARLVVLAIMSGLLQNLQIASLGPDALDVPMVACLLLLLHVALNSFQLAVGVGIRAIDTMATLMYVLLPLLSTTLAAVGAFTTVALMHPILIASVGLMSSLVQHGVFPMLRLSIVLGVVGNTFPGFPLRRLATLFERVGSLILGGAFVGFAAMITARGMLAPVADGVAIRAAKYVGGKVMPVLGNTFAQALDVAVGGSLLIKNGLGAFGLGAILVIVAFPLVKVLAILFTYRIVTALIEPISDPRLVAAMASCGSIISIIFVAVMTVTLAFLLTITVLVGMGNLTAMLR
ncbi:MAG: hypothetical protein GX986_00500 [Firmicutes bacterium]|nr:hypothetical protein [Bacillota bacterium]